MTTIILVWNRTGCYQDNGTKPTILNCHVSNRSFGIATCTPVVQSSAEIKIPCSSSLFQFSLGIRGYSVSPFHQTCVQSLPRSHCKPTNRVSKDKAHFQPWGALTNRLIERGWGEESFGSSKSDWLHKKHTFHCQDVWQPTKICLKIQPNTLRGEQTSPR